MACFAAGLAVGVGVTEDILVAPSFLACSTAAFVVALSIACLAASALALASSLALAFSSAVKSLLASIAASFAFNASSMACFAAGFACAVGVTESTLVAPSALACSTAAFVVA